jgi:hypothetical protein
MVIDLKAGELTELPGGSYVLTVADHEELKFVLVREIPDLKKVQTEK